MYLLFKNEFMIDYKDLDNHFILPERLSPFYGEGEIVRFPRKLKKRMQKYCGSAWGSLTNGQRAWQYMEVSSPDYKRFLIKKVCDSQPEYIRKH